MLTTMRPTIRLDSKWFFLVGGAAIGLVAGRYTGSRATVPPVIPAASEAHSAKARGKSPSAATHAERLKASRLALIREMGSSKDSKAREAFTDSLRAADLPDLLAVLLADAGLEGIDYMQKEMLQKAVNHWVAEDIDAALDWAAHLPQPKLRRYFQKMMLGELAKSAPFDAADRALGLEAGDAEFDASSIISDGISELTKTSGHEREIAELVRKAAVKDGKGSFGMSQTFAEDFGHEVLLNALAELKQQGLNFRFAPMGMLEAWAKRDAEAAHAWSLANGKVGFEDWNDVLSGVAATLGQEVSGQWFLGKYSEVDEEQRKIMTAAFTNTYKEPAARMVLADRLARQMPSDLAGEFVEEILTTHLGHVSSHQAEGLSLLSWYPNPEERADVLVKRAGYRSVDKLLERFPESRLETYGVTRELLEAAIERTRTPKPR
jgi:hypothetical protein